MHIDLHSPRPVVATFTGNEPRGGGSEWDAGRRAHSRRTIARSFCPFSVTEISYAANAFATISLSLFRNVYLILVIIIFSRPPHGGHPRRLSGALHTVPEPRYFITRPNVRINHNIRIALHARTAQRTRRPMFVFPCNILLYRPRDPFRGSTMYGTPANNNTLQCSGSPAGPTAATTRIVRSSIRTYRYYVSDVRNKSYNTRVDSASYREKSAKFPFKSCRLTCARRPTERVVSKSRPEFFFFPFFRSCSRRVDASATTRERRVSLTRRQTLSAVRFSPAATSFGSFFGKNIYVDIFYQLLRLPTLLFFLLSAGGHCDNGTVLNRSP